MVKTFLSEKTTFIQKMLSIGLLLAILIPPPVNADMWIKTDMGIPPGIGHYFHSITAADIDKDGVKEFYLLDRNTEELFCYHYNQKAHNWTIERITPKEFSVFTIVYGDVYNNNIDELYVLAQNNSRNSIYQISKVQESWQYDELTELHLQKGIMVLGDGNNDGRDEFFYGGIDGHIYMVYKGGDWNIIDVGIMPYYNNQTHKIKSIAIGDADFDNSSEIYSVDGQGQVCVFKWNQSSWNISFITQLERMPSSIDTSFNLLIGDADNNELTELYATTPVNGSVYRFVYNSTRQEWEKTVVISIKNEVSYYTMAIGDGDSDKNNELYLGKHNRNLVYMMKFDRNTNSWQSSGIGSGGDSITGIVVDKLIGDDLHNAVYASCADGHCYQFLFYDVPTITLDIWSDTHPKPGTWYTENIVHVLWAPVGNNSTKIAGYSILWDYSQNTFPDELIDLNQFSKDMKSPPLSDGIWYFHIRVQDNLGIWSDSATHFGPICVDQNMEILRISNLTVSGISNSQAVILWSTNQLTDSEVHYGIYNSSEVINKDKTEVISHSIYLSNLTPLTKYQFFVRSTLSQRNETVESEIFTFTTVRDSDNISPKVSGLKVTNITKTSATISWLTDEPSDSVIDYGNSTEYGSQQSLKIYTLYHNITLTGLSPGTRYHFTIYSTDPSGNPSPNYTDQTFKTSGSDTIFVEVDYFPWPLVLVTIVLIAGLLWGLVAYRKRSTK